MKRKSMNMKINYFLNPEMKGEKVVVVSIETKNISMTRHIDAVATVSVEVELPPMAEVGFDGDAFVVKYESVINDRSYEEQNFCGTLDRRHTRIVRIRTNMYEDELAGVVKALDAIVEEARAEHEICAAIAISKMDE